jgi:hypothetical protein
MQGFRFRIIDLVTFIVFLALGLAALQVGPHCQYALFLVLISTGTIGARYGGGGRRFFWLGVAVFGWGYAAIGLRFGFLTAGPELDYRIAAGFAGALMSGLAASWFAPSTAAEGANPTGR